MDGNDDFRNLNQAATFFKATSERLRLFLSNFSRVCQVKNKVDLLSLSLSHSSYILHVYRLPGSFTSTIKVGCTLTTRSHSPLVTPANFSKLTIDDCSHVAIFINYSIIFFFSKNLFFNDIFFKIDRTF